MKKHLSLLLILTLLLSLLVGCGSTNTPAESETPASEQTESTQSSEPAEAPAETPTETPAEESDTVLPRLMVLSGPTGVGAAKLLADNESAAEEEKCVASAEVVADNEAVKNALVSGETDIAAVATNLAATLFNKTNGSLEVLAVNTLGVLYLLENGESVQSMSDLAGKTLYATGQGANPEYVLNYLLSKNGVEPADVDIQWLTPQEITAKMTAGEPAICMLPVPAATAVLMKAPEVRQALSLSEAWDALGEGPLTQGCIVVRREFAEQHPAAVERFLEAYRDSLAYMSDEANRADASELVAHFEITPNAQIAAKALPQCNLTFLTGNEMKSALESFYQVLLAANPASVGGALPDASFYYGAD